MKPIRLKVDDTVSSVDLSSFARYMSWHPEYLGYFLAKPGSEHHSLLSFLTRQLPQDSTVVDLGTLYGASALALAHGNPSGRVITYDIRDNIPPAAATIRNVGNIEVRIRDGILDSDTYLGAKLILLDVDPHDGIQERHFIQRMMHSQYKGVVVCDDIYCNAAMKSFWDWIPLEKHDVTQFGHCSGTGIVVFDGDTIGVDVHVMQNVRTR